MNTKRLLRRKLEKLGLAKRTKPHSKKYRGHKPVGWKDLRK
jgi:hypothetical protein